MNAIKRCALAAVGALMLLPAWAENKWLGKKHDFGAFDENVGTVYCEFRLVNTGT